MTTVGWYVHHHGRGHRTRFLAVRPHLDADVVAFSTLPAPTAMPPRTDWVVLPRDDNGPIRGDVTAGGALHWAPVGHLGHTSRLTAMARTTAERDLDAMVVDVSVEVTLFLRLLGIPVVIFAQPGDRTDAPHRLAHQVAERIVVPWTEGAIALSGLDPRDRRLRHVGAISRWDGRARAGRPVPSTVGVLGDTQVAPVDGLTIDAPAWIDDPWPMLCGSEVVVIPAGLNAVADVAAAGARAVVVPQQRPFGEQSATAAALAERGLAVVTDHVDGLALDAARRLRPDWSEWGVRGGAARAARAIAEVIA